MTGLTMVMASRMRGQPPDGAVGCIVRRTQPGAAKVDLLIGPYGTNMRGGDAGGNAEAEGVDRPVRIGGQCRVCLSEIFLHDSVRTDSEVSADQGILRFSHCAKPEAADNRNR